MSTGYDFGRDDFPRLLIAKFYPERTDTESAVIRDFLIAHLREYERVSFSVRLGTGVTPDPTHLPAVQQAQIFSSKKRVDVVGWRTKGVDLIDAKQRLRAEVLGQLRMYRQLWMADYPDSLEPRLVAIGRYSDEDTLRTLAAEGIDVYLYASPSPP